jgi:beta-aspartyl-peptidase (threonine type)
MSIYPRHLRLLLTICVTLLALAGVTTTQAQKDDSLKPIGIVIHGGAGTIDRDQMTPEREREYRAALQSALSAGYAVLERGGTSLDAVQAAVVVMEDSPLFNAGKGAVLTSEGEAELDASIMDGRTLGAGAVCGVKRIKNPIELSRAVMDKSSHVLFAADGAEKFAKEQGFKLVRNSYFITDRRKLELQRAKDAEKKKGKTAKSDLDAFSFGTVGAVALDRHGNLAAGTSTGGRTNKRPGRIGDSPIIGAGTYANNATCAVSGTGHGEYFMRGVAAYDVSALMEYRGLEVAAAAREVIGKLGKLGGTGGLIAIDRNGKVALPFNTAGMYRAHRVSGGAAVVEIFADK